MAFLNTVFPPKIAYGSSGGPIRNTRVATAASGFEQRVSFWDESLRRYDISYGIRGTSDLYEVLELYEAANGKFDFFLFKDNSDFKSVGPSVTITDDDVIIGTGDGIEVDFQLIKEYIIGAEVTTRIIRRPIPGTLLISVNAIGQTIDWTVSATTGIVTFDTPPVDTHIVRAGFEFYVPVRFDTDDLSWILSHFQHGIIDAVLLVEVKE